jgi:phosphate transport system permease protein
MLTGIVLSLGRAVGDTLIALMIAGNAVAMPASPLHSARTLTAHIALVIAADFDSIEFRTLFSCGIILYAFTLVMVGVVRRLTVQGNPLP